MIPKSKVGHSDFGFVNNVKNLKNTFWLEDNEYIIQMWLLQVADYNPMQMAVTAISDMNKRVRGGAAGAKEDWLDTVNKNLEQEQKVRSGSQTLVIS